MIVFFELPREAKLHYRSIKPDVRALFPLVATLMRLLLVCPVTSCECERRFSTLRRLETWLRSTMNQKRLNNISACHVHKEELGMVNVQDLAKAFVSRSEIRKTNLMIF